MTRESELEKLNSNLDSLKDVIDSLTVALGLQELEQLHITAQDHRDSRTAYEKIRGVKPYGLK